jgi:hypothetical protein
LCEPWQSARAGQAGAIGLGRGVLWGGGRRRRGTAHQNDGKSLTLIQVSGSACGYPFKEGQEYLVYADGKQELKVDLCSETKPLSKAGVNLQALRNSERPKDGGPLSDTSGGISVGMMAGVAGLGMAASFLLIVRLVRAD